MGEIDEPKPCSSDGKWVRPDWNEILRKCGFVFIDPSAEPGGDGSRERPFQSTEQFYSAKASQKGERNG